MVLFVLFESAAGFALFQLKEFDETNATEQQVQKQVSRFETFSRIAHLKSFFPFTLAHTALENALNAGTGKITQQLSTFLTENLPIVKKKGKIVLGVNDNKLAGAISEGLGIQTLTSKTVLELIRGFRTHFVAFLKNEDFTQEQLARAQLGLAHSFSRNKIALDVNRQDKPIIQSICLLQLLDKDVNTLSMRIREWFSWHFPELSKLITDNYIFTKLAFLIQNRDNMKEVSVEQIEEITQDGEIAQRVGELSSASMGQEMSEFDTQCLHELCEKALRLYEFRKEMQEYLKDKMEAVAPNLTSLIGENVGAKLISHSGSLSNLAKYPASTIQILGAEKALFRALKTKSNTPKYGLLYHSSFIGRATGKNKGKISRFVANKCSIAARLDNFLINPTSRFGDRLKQQVQTRMKYLNDGGQIDKNEQIMDEIVDELKQENLYFESTKEMKKAMKKKKKQAKGMEVEEEEEPKRKKSKGKKEEEIEVEEEEKPKKKKKLST